MSESSTIVQRIWNYCNILRGERWLEGMGKFEFAVEAGLARDKVNLDIFWLRDESLEDSARLPAPDVLAAEIVEDLRSALEQFENIAGELGE